MRNMNWDQIAVGNYTYPLYPFSYYLDSMVRLEVANIEIWAAGPHLYLEDMTYDMLRKMDGEIRKRKLRPICLTPEQCMYPINIGAEEPWIRKRSVRYFEKGLMAAETLGINRMLITPGDGYRNKTNEKTRKYTVDNLQYLAGKAKEKKITLLLEHLTAETTNLAIKAAQLADLCQEVGCENLLGMIDTDMMSRYGESVNDYNHALNGKIGHVHFTDGMPGGHLAVGDGILPMGQYWNELCEIDYSGYVSLEIINDRYHLNPDEAVERSLQWIKERIKREKRPA